MPNIDVVGLPGIRAARTASYRNVFRQGDYNYLAQGRIINGTKSADSTNTGDTRYLRAGLLMGKISATGLYANSVIGVTTAAAAAAATTITVGAATVTELVRRVGSTGTFKLTGPTVANGPVLSET